MQETAWHSQLVKEATLTHGRMYWRASWPCVFLLPAWTVPLVVLEPHSISGEGGNRLDTFDVPQCERNGGTPEWRTDRGPQGGNYF